MATLLSRGVEFGSLVHELSLELFNSQNRTPDIGLHICVNYGNQGQI